MTVKAEVELRREADRAEGSNNLGTGSANARLASADRYLSKPNKPAVQAAMTMNVPQFSARQVYFTVGLYGILLSSALWASVNMLQWVWHKLL